MSLQNSSQQNEASLSLAARLWIYQSERFPVFRTALMVLFFTAATLIVSASLAGREPPPLWNFMAIWGAVFLIFFQMRVFDEMKDAELDAKYRPERAVPRGLVSIFTLKGLALLAGIVIVLLTVSLSWKNFWPLALVWGWLFLMTNEFFVPRWLNAHAVVYLLSHMLIMPLIDFYVSSGEWVRAGAHPPSGLFYFLLLSFLNGCILEIGRKTWANESEREGVESYSKLWGAKRASRVWLGLVLVAYMVLLFVAYELHSFKWVFIPASLGLIYMMKLASDFYKQPTQANEKRLDNASGIWVLLCYGLAGFPPLLMSVLNSGGI